MPLPVGLTTIIVTGSFPSGGVGTSPLSGTVTFTPSTDLTDAAGHVIIRAAPVEASLDYTGGISVQLVCTDNADLSPTGWTWTVAERIVGLGVRSYSVLLPASDGPTIDLAALVHVTPVTPPSGALLAVNNLADVDSAPVSRQSLGLGTVAVLSTPGGTTEFLRADGTWDVPAAGGGGVQIGGDLGGTDSAPTVTGTHLASPLPLAQGGTSAADAPGARTALGLGTAATQPSSAFDAAGAAAAALSSAQAGAAATYVPLTAEGAANGIATLDSAGHLAASQAALLLAAADNLAGLADASAARGHLGLGTAATQPGSAFDASGAAAAALAAAESNAASTYLPLTGGALTGPLAMGGHKVTGVSNGTLPTDGATLGQVPTVGAAGADAGVALSSTDPTTTNPRTPTAHAASHATGGADPLAPAAIGAAASSSLGGAASLNVGTATGTVAAGDDSRITGAVQSAGTGLTKTGTSIALTTPVSAANLPRLDQITAPQAALGLNNQKITSVANGVLAADGAAFGQIPLVGAAGAGAGVALSSTDATTANARTPTAHAATHASGGSDPVTPAAVGAVAASTLGAPSGTATLDSGGHLAAAQSANLVDLASAQTVAGVKAFTSSPTGPTPVGASDLVPKAYADSIAQGLSVKTSCRLATTAALPANLYSNGASGVGATLTGVSVGVLTVDGSTVNAGDRVLVQNEATGANNGIYTCTIAGAAGAAYVLTRGTDMDQAAEIPGAFVFVEAGSTNAGAGFVVAGAGPYTVGTTPIVWTQFSGAGEITAGTGLTKSGNTISLTTPVPVSLGGTGQATAQAAINALTGTQAAGSFLRSDGTNATLAAIQAADVPTLNQSTTGTAANVSGTVAVGNGGTGATTAAGARTSLGLGTQAQQNFGTASGALAEILPPWSCTTSGGSQLTTGVLILNLIRPGPILVTNLAIWLTLAGITASGVNGLALYDESATLIDQTGDMSAAFATLALAEAPLGTPRQLAANTNYYIGVLAHFSGTTPKAGSSIAGLTIPVMRGHYLSLTKSSVASFPASFTPSTYTTSTAAYAMQMS